LIECPFVESDTPHSAIQLFVLVDASQAGSGQLEIMVSTGSPTDTQTGFIGSGGGEENVPNFVTSEGGGRFRVTFTPLKPDTHYISVRFNGQAVPGLCD